MMRTNGTLKYLIDAGDGLNEDGEPVQGESTYSKEVPCLIRTVTNNSRGRYEDGKFNQYSYEILLESGVTVPADTDCIMLTRDGQSLGEYTLQGKPERGFMGRVKILV